jgi:TatD DNase family protein
MIFADSHAHLTSKELRPHAEAIIERAKAAGVANILNICTDRASLSAGLALKLQNSGATTPHDVAKDGEADFPIFAEAARNGTLLAIGETGLDYHYEHSPKALQRQFMIRYLQLALECSLPVIFHCRDAFADLFAICDDHYRGPAILHCFTGSRDEAEEALSRGWFISFSGIITFKKSEALRAVVRAVPLTQMLIETDAPYLAPQSRRGQLNEPAFLPETAATVAQVKGISIEDVAEKTRKNFFRLIYCARLAS